MKSIAQQSGSCVTTANKRAAFSGRAAGFAEVVDLPSGQVIARVPERAHRGGIVAMALSADGQLLATSGEDGAVIVWRMP
ncbi:MAG TPA: hypothetical protein VG488_13920 [Candidatus Angelobacter sp.]|jgi:WD40 repeat protein|nr:hypothetical protein [Candidatus Angelobacter sp.]